MRAWTLHRPHIHVGIDNDHAASVYFHCLTDERFHHDQRSHHDQRFCGSDNHSRSRLLSQLDDALRSGGPGREL